MRIYLDNCCFNRPFDDQSQIKIKLESEAKLYIQGKVIEKEIELVWSYILDYENNHNPFDERKNIINKWKKKAIIDVVENNKILKKANELIKKGIKTKDALHIACAVHAASDYFITTDEQIIKKCKTLRDISVINPLQYIT